MKMAYRTFNIVDEDQDRELSLAEFVHNMDCGMMDDYLQSMDLNRSHAYDLFKILDEDESGSICMAQFLKGYIRLQGTTRASDVSQILIDVRKLRRSWSDQLSMLEDRMEIGQTEIMNGVSSVRKPEEVASASSVVHPTSTTDQRNSRGSTDSQ